jgi:hypothetical protein
MFLQSVYVLAVNSRSSSCFSLSSSFTWCSACSTNTFSIHACPASVSHEMRRALPFYVVPFFVFLVNLFVQLLCFFTFPFFSVPLCLPAPYSIVSISLFAKSFFVSFDYSSFPFLLLCSSLVVDTNLSNPLTIRSLNRCPPFFFFLFYIPTFLFSEKVCTM